MNDRFDELTKSMAQSVTRRGAFKKFAVGLAGFVVAALGLPRQSNAVAHAAGYCEVDLYTGTLTGMCVFKARKVKVPCPRGDGNCWTLVCDQKVSYNCQVGLPASSTNDLEHCYHPYSQIACQ